MRVHGITLEGKESNTHNPSQNLFFTAVCVRTLTFFWPGWYLNFSIWFMKNMNIIWTEKYKIMK
jgi:hypothetical protein